MLYVEINKCKVTHRCKGTYSTSTLASTDIQILFLHVSVTEQ